MKVEEFKVKSVVNFLLASSMVVPNITFPKHEKKIYDSDITFKNNYSVYEFKESNSLYNTYKMFVNQSSSVEKYNNSSSFDQITTISEQPNLTVIDHLEENGTSSAIMYDTANDDYYYLETSDNTSNIFMSLNKEEYLINGNGDNISLEAENGEELPLVETYFDESYANISFDWIIKENADVSPYATWNLISSGNYYNSQNLTVTVLSIVVSVVTSGVASAYIQINGLVSRILAYIGIGWTVGQVLTQNYLIYISQWNHFTCSVYYRTKYDYYVIPKSASGSTVTATRDFYKYQYTLNANPSLIPSGCSGFTNREEGPYSYH